MNKPRLHELLAVETNLESQMLKCCLELAATFEKKRHLFEEKRVTFTPNTEGAQPVTESQSDIQSNVPKELDWLAPFIVKSLDASYQVAEANTEARADVILEDSEIPLLIGVPATALLELEKRIDQIGTILKSVPTLDPAKGFSADSHRTNVFMAREVIKNRTRKAKKLYVKYEATKEHPAQTELVDEDVPVGTVRELEWSGLITPAEKSELIARCEALQRAIRRARSRANEVEVDTSKRIGNVLLKYVLGK